MKKSTDNKIIIILGPSASGKTDLAIEIANKYKTYVISADSRQIYKKLNYSTGKIKIGDLKRGHPIMGSPLITYGIKYYGYNILKPNKEYSAGDFVEYTKKIIIKEKSTPIICGGTGMYISSLVGNTSLSKVKRNTLFRKKLQKKTLFEIQQILKKEGFNIETLNNSEKNNKQRLIRKIEIIKSKQKNEEYFSLKEHCKTAGYLYIGLQKKDYKESIENWIDENFEEIKKEVEWLNLKYPKSHLFTGFIFKEMRDYLNNKSSIEKTKNLITVSYLQYIKRQMTYFKKYFPQTVWFNNRKKALEYIQKYKSLS